MALADIIQQDRHVGTILEAISASHGRNEVVPPLKPGEWIRASGLAGVCPREEVLCSLHDISRAGVVDVDLDLIFEHGHALHWVLQNHILPRYAGLFRGQWSCLKCGHTVGSVVPGVPLMETLVARPTVCPICGPQKEPAEWLYREILFTDEEAGLQGHPDGYLALSGHDGLGIFEAKTISEKGFSGVRDNPLLDHVIQMHTYFGLTGLRWGRILYWCKGKNGRPALKEHFVPRNEELVGRTRTMAMSIHIGVETGAVPARLCPSENCARALACAVRGQCFHLV